MTKGVEDVKVIFFDFDNTLYLWSLSPAQRSIYEAEVRTILQKYMDSGVAMYIVSYSPQVHQHCQEMNLQHFFNKIVNTPRWTKVDMMKEILNDLEGVLLDDILYFDDDYDAILEAKAYGISSTVCVSKRQGILPFYQK